LKDVIEQGKTASDNSVCAADTSFPLRTDWTVAREKAFDTAADDVTEFAERLARVKLWLGLKAPPGGGDSDFPYQLALKRRDGAAGTLVDGGGSVGQNEVYDLVLHVSGNAPAEVDRQWVYVLGIDCTGKGRLLYPVAAEGNQLPERGAVPTEIPLTASGGGIKIVPPFGLDSYILLTTSEQLPDPSLLNFDAVLTRGAHGPSSPLAALLGAASAGTRGMESPVPSDWTIRYLQVRSVPRETAVAK
jgi:hypothetical protein